MAEKKSTGKLSIGFIGCGAMGGALAGAICKGNKKYASSLTVSSASFEETKNFAAKNKCTAARTNIEVVEKSRFIFIAVKPVHVAGVLTEISDYVKKDTVIISMAAGLPLPALMALCPINTPVVRIMPNTPALVGQAMTAVCFNDKISAQDKATVCKLLETAGIVNVVPENMMDCVTAVSGSGPAYAFMFIEAMADAAVKCGMKRDDAYIYAAQTLKGAACQVLETGKAPAVLKDAVCSPGGTTIEAVSALEHGGFRAAVIDAVTAAYEKSKSMR